MSGSSCRFDDVGECLGKIRTHVRLSATTVGKIQGIRHLGSTESFMRYCALFLLASFVPSAHGQVLSVRPLTSTCPQHEIKLPPKTSFPFANVRQDAFGIVVTYDLDGSGKAQNVSLVSASPDRRFDNAFLRAIRKSRFTKGVTGISCRLEQEFKRRGSGQATVIVP